MQLPKLNTCGYYLSDLPFPGRFEERVRRVREYEIEYVQNDCGFSVINGCEYPLAADHIVVAKPGDLRASHLDAPLATMYLRVTADGEVAARMDALPRTFPLLRAQQVRELMAELIASGAASEPDELYLTGKLLLLICLLSADSAVDGKKLSGLYPRMHEAKRFIEQHYAEPILAADIAKSIFISESHLRFSFRELYGITPHEYLAQIRLDAAKKLLSNSTLGYTEIAAACHLGSAKNFSTFFRHKTGLTPTEYRRAAIKRYAE